MSGYSVIDWAGLCISFFDTILLVWLGITVFLNAEKRTSSLVLVTEGLLTAAVFFYCAYGYPGAGRAEPGAKLQFLVVYRLAADHSLPVGVVWGHFVVFGILGRSALGAFPPARLLAWDGLAAFPGFDCPAVVFGTAAFGGLYF